MHHREESRGAGEGAGAGGKGFKKKLKFDDDYAPLEAFLIGKCGKTAKEAMLTGFAEARMLIEGKDAEMRERWEMTRWMMFTIVSGNPYIRTGHRPHRPSDILRFPWDGAIEVKERKPVTAEQKAGLDEIMKAFYKRKKN